MKRSYCAFKVGIQIQDLQLFEYYIILLCCQYLSWPRSREREEYFSWLKRLCPLGVGCCCKLIMTESSTCHCCRKVQ